MRTAIGVGAQEVDLQTLVLGFCFSIGFVNVLPVRQSRLCPSDSLPFLYMNTSCSALHKILHQLYHLEMCSPVGSAISTAIYIQTTVNYNTSDR